MVYQRTWHGLWGTVFLLFAQSNVLWGDIIDDVEDLRTKPAEQAPPAETKPAQDADAPDKAHKKNKDVPEEGWKPKKESETIYYESRSLKGRRQEGIIELNEEVMIRQADMKMDADQATIRFNVKRDAVQMVTARGNVKFYKIDPETKEPIRAESKEAVFDNAKRTVVLMGDPKLWRGKDLMRGKQITYELDSGWVHVDRAEGVVQPQKNTKTGDKNAAPKDSGLEK